MSVAFPPVVFTWGYYISSNPGNIYPLRAIRYGKFEKKCKYVNIERTNVYINMEDVYIDICLSVGNQNKGC